MSGEPALMKVAPQLPELSPPPQQQQQQQQQTQSAVMRRTTSMSDLPPLSVADEVPPPQSPPPQSPPPQSPRTAAQQKKRVLKLPSLAKTVAAGAAPVVMAPPAATGQQQMTAMPPSPTPTDVTEMLMKQRTQHAEEAATALEAAVRALTALSGTLLPPSCTAAAAKAMADSLCRAASLAETACALASKALLAGTPAVLTPRSSTLVSPSTPRGAKASVQTQALSARGMARSAGTVSRGTQPPPPLAPPMLKSEPDSLSVACALQKAQTACSTAEIVNPLAAGRSLVCVPVVAGPMDLVGDPVCRTLALRATAQQQQQMQQQLEQQQQQQQEQQQQLEKEKQRQQEQEQQQQQEQDETTEASQAEGAEKQAQQRKLEPLVFEPVEIDEAQGVGMRSALTEALRQADAATRAHQGQRYAVSLPPDYRQRVTVELRAQATVRDAISEALRACSVARRNSREHDGPILLDDPDAYVLYTADERGRPDRDFPAADAGVRVADLQCDTFALAENTSYKPACVATVWYVAADGSKRSVQLPFCPSHTAGDLLVQACKLAGGLRPAEHELLFADLDMAFDRGTRLGDTGTTEFRLRRRPQAAAAQAAATTAGSDSGNDCSADGTSSRSSSSKRSSGRHSKHKFTSSGSSAGSAADDSGHQRTSSGTASTAPSSAAASAAGADGGEKRHVGAEAEGEIVDMGAPDEAPATVTVTAGAVGHLGSLLHNISESVSKAKRLSVYNLKALCEPAGGDAAAAPAPVAVTPENACELREYRVLYHKKSHRKSAKTMKVDGDWVTFMGLKTHSRKVSASGSASGGSFVSDTSSSSTSRKDSKPKSVIKSAISMDNVSDVGVVPGKPGTFYLVVGADRLEFESASRDEIVAKVSTILRMRAAAASAADAAAAAAAAAAAEAGKR